MIENFEKIKGELSEISDVVNSFKSEAVQLRIIDYLLGNLDIAEEAIKNDKKTPLKKIVKRKSKTTAAKSPVKKTNNTTGTGAKSMLNRLLESNFLDSPKTIKQMIDYIDLNYAKKIKSNEISGKLARLVRSGELSREKNDEKQYEYKKPE